MDTCTKFESAECTKYPNIQCICKSHVKRYFLNSRKSCKRYFKGDEIHSEDSRLKITVDNKPGSDKLTETTVTLSVPKCSKDDTGEYTLKLKNKYGEAESNVSINFYTRILII